jgi:hypothetical protein
MSSDIYFDFVVMIANRNHLTYQYILCLCMHDRLHKSFDSSYF